MKIQEGFDISQRAIDLFIEYQTYLANEVHLRISQRASELRTLVSFTIILNIEASKISGLNPRDRLFLFECWIDWRPNERNPTKKALPIQQIDLSNVSYEYQRNTKEEATATHFYTTRDRLRPHPINPAYKTITITFECPHVFYSDMEESPFYLNYLNMGWHLGPSCAKKTLVFLQFPQKIALRGRRDNSDYHSTTLGLNEVDQRKVTFFANQDIWIHYSFGITDSEELSAPILLMFRAGVGLLSVGVGLYLFYQYFYLSQQKQPALAVPFIILGLTPWFIEAFRRLHLVSSSASVYTKRLAWADRVTVRCFFIQSILIVFGITAAFLNLPFLLLASISIISSAGLLILAIASYYFFAFSFGMHLGYSCDCCGKRLRVRKLQTESTNQSWWRDGLVKVIGGVWSHKKSRRILCYKCCKDKCWDSVPSSLYSTRLRCSNRQSK